MAAYYKKVLQPGEVVRFRGHLHWIIYTKAMVLFAVGIAFAVAALDSAAQAPLWAVLGVLSLLLSFIFFVPAFIRRWTTEIVVTDRRVLRKVGLVRRSTIEMNMTKIETVDIRQGVLGRLLGFGAIVIRGTGVGLEPLRQVARPLALRNAILVG